MLYISLVPSYPLLRRKVPSRASLGADNATVFITVIKVRCGLPITDAAAEMKIG